ncbi:MAG: TatD family hydrolase [Prolixibacteraceae bacterium]|jgi:TatD DNase family protein|nr:TatD family hydrolase [Prolixibacteraceae bacterium]
MQFVDIHTHEKKGTADIEILNVFAQNLHREIELPVCTAGFHPWHLNNYDEREMINLLHDLADRYEILAIGECGIDLTISAEPEKQERLFLKQAGIAENKKKPLIVHCVKAYPEMIRLQKLINANMPWILHGYSAKPQVTKSLLSYNFYFSFGETLLNEKRKAVDSLKIIPTDRLFFETDESHVPVKEIYFFAAKILRMDAEALKNQVYENYKRVFGNR